MPRIRLSDAGKVIFGAPAVAVVGIRQPIQQLDNTLRVAHAPHVGDNFAKLIAVGVFGDCFERSAIVSHMYDD